VYHVHFYFIFQVQNILKRKAEIMEGYEENASADRKRLRVQTPNEELNNLMWAWFQKVRSNGITVTGPMLQEKALMYASELNVTDFKASTGWLTRFRQRHNISFLSVCGESACVSQDTVEDWKDKLSDIIEGYSARDIYNMDETGLFFRALPDKTLSVKGEDCKGGKKSKERITLSLCVNMEGDFEKPVVIGRAAKPRCFKNLKTENLPVTWYHNQKAWMTQKLFKNWCMDFNERMKRAGRHVILFLDNAPAHPDDLQPIV
jgi:hypothetical protein